MDGTQLWSNITIIAGALLFASAALGVIRFPDVYTRMSAVSTAGGAGIILIITGSLLTQLTLTNVIQAIVIIVLQLVTSAIGSISIARAAYLIRTEPNPCFFNEMEENGSSSFVALDKGE